MKTRILLTFAFAASALLPSEAQTILSLRDSINDPHIIYPESFETDVQKMRENWYLSTYAVLDESADERPVATVTEEEYIRRLSLMPTTIEMPYNSIVRSYIEMYTERRRSLVENMLGMSLYYMPIFESALDKYGLPLELKYLPIIESALNPNAVSRVGATGLWQFMLPTATGLGMEINSLIDERRDPYVASDCAAKYLKQLYDTYGDWSLAIASYNCGPGNVNKALRRAGGGKKDFWEIYQYLPSETRGYVPAFIAANYVMTYYPEHNIRPALARRPIITDTVHVTKRVNLQQVSDVLDIPMDALRILNPQFRTDVIPGDIKPYALVLPSLQSYCYVANEDSIIAHNSALYARRTVVEPNDGSSRTGSDDSGEYVEELVVKYHKVKRGETLSSIAKKYGVTQSDIRSANKIGRKVKRGQRLKINTYVRRYLTADELAARSDTSIQTSAGQQQIQESDETSVRTAEPAPATEKRKPSAPEKQKDKKYKVRKGDTLSRIASRHGVTVNELRKANGLKGDNIREGQTLKIPAKKAAKKKSRKRRR